MKTIMVCLALASSVAILKKIDNFLLSKYQS